MKRHELGQKITSMRQIARLTQRQVAKMVGVPVSTYTKWELLSEPGGRNLLSLATALGVPVQELFEPLTAEEMEVLAPRKKMSVVKSKGVLELEVELQDLRDRVANIAALSAALDEKYHNIHAFVDKLEKRVEKIDSVIQFIRDAIRVKQ